MPARFCPQCQQEVSNTARFCPNCANPLTAPGSPIPTNPPGNTTQIPVFQPMEPAPLDRAVARSRTALVATMAVALIILFGIVIVLAQRPRSSVLSADSVPLPPAPAVIVAPSEPPAAAPPLISAPTAPAVASPPLTGAPSITPGSLPPDAAAYVKFLQGIENRRLALDSDLSLAEPAQAGAQQIKSGEDNPDPDQGSSDYNSGQAKIGSNFGSISLKWQTLAGDFDAVSPPESCQELANQYDKFLAASVDTVSKAQVAVMNHDVSALGALESSEQVVTSTGTQADTDLTDLCNRYNAPKPFSIQPEGAAPSLITQ